jgi:hypothetical protein
MGKNQDPGSGINIPDPQHCCVELFFHTEHCSCSRTIPFPTKRATFSEVKRVHELLCRVELFPSLEALSAAQPLTREQIKKAAKVRKFSKLILLKDYPPIRL